MPVINLESAMYHPCQALADMMTIKETLGGFQGREVSLVWANHPKALPLAVPQSFALAAAQCGVDLTIAAPKEYMLPDDDLAELGETALAAGGSRRRLLAPSVRMIVIFVRLYHLYSTGESGASDTTGTETSRRQQHAATRLSGLRRPPAALPRGEVPYHDCSKVHPLARRMFSPRIRRGTGGRSGGRRLLR